MRQYTKLITLSVVLVVIIAAITWVMISDIDLGLFKNLSIAGIQEKQMQVENLMVQQNIQELGNTAAKAEQQTAKNSFDVAKQQYEDIDASTISIVQEATKEENYFIEYLWIVLGNYASANKVAINILTPGAVNEVIVETEEGEEDKDNNNKNEKQEDDGAISETPQVEVKPLMSGIKITVEGRYADVADFVFDVENDKSLRFRLDNIVMAYSKNNKIKATFDVLSLSVLK